MTVERLSDEKINAFVDQELDTEERLDILRLSEEQEVVRTQLCEARNLKDLVKNAYAEVPRAERPAAGESGRTKRLAGFAGAAVLAVLVFLGGLMTGQALPGSQDTLAKGDPVFLDVSELFTLEEARVAHGGASNIILHLATNDSNRVEDALEKLERFIGDQRDRQRLGQQRVAVEIVANGYGLDLLRVAQTPYEGEIRRLVHDDYVTILACRQAVQRLKEQGVEVDLIPEADMAATALDRIIQRLREGWVYVKV